MALGFSGSNGGIQFNQTKEETIMAVGFSGSNGGIDPSFSQFNFPMEVSYFINNACNLSCTHCYVGTKRNSNRLSVAEWRNVFRQCMELGALTFGNVGKEPTLAWDETIELLRWFKSEKVSIPRLRYGIVTNGTLLTAEKIADLVDAEPTYIDVSFDGDEEQHDAIRGKGAYKKTMDAIAGFPPSLMEKVFISFTANATNLAVFAVMAKDLYQLGVRQFLISPYVPTETSAREDKLLAENTAIVLFAQKLLNGSVLDWNKYGDIHVYFKSDYTTSRELMFEFQEAQLVKLHELLMDDYGVIFNQYLLGSNVIYFNYIPFDDSFIKSIRIGHDGYVSDCKAMFFIDEEYRKLSIGNIRQSPIKEILQHKLIK